MDIFLPKTIKSFIPYIDKILLDYRGYQFSVAIKTTLINMLKMARKQNNKQFNDFVVSTDKYYWVLAQACGVAFDMVATGHYHIIDRLNYEGEQLQKFYFMCLSIALENKFINQELYEQQKRNFIRQVEETGKFA